MDRNVHIQNRPLSKYIKCLWFMGILFMVPMVLFGQTTHWRLIWDKNPEPDMSHYLIYRDTAINPTTQIGRTEHPDTVYTDTTIVPGVQYYYRVTAVDSSDLASDYSDNVSAAIPLVTDIPGQTVGKGGTFATIPLDDYVSDPDNADSEIDWTYSGNTELTVSIDANHVATIGIPSSSWYGNETITFTATDPDSFFNLDSATFIVENNEPPVVDDIPDQTVNQNENFATFDLDPLVADPDNSDSEISWSYSGNNELTVSIDANHVVTVTKPSSDWTGSETITFTATDPGGLSDSDPAVFKTNAPPQVSDIPDQTVNQGSGFAQIHLDDYVSDPDNTDEEMTWNYSGNSELTVTIENRIATIAIPSSDWYGSETITFTATDPGGLYDSDAAAFKVNARPVADQIPDQSVNQDEEFATFDLDTLVSDPDNTDAELSWSYSGNSALTINIDTNHLVTISKASDWYGSETITFTVTDPGGLSDNSAAVFSCNATPVVDDIPDQLLNEGQSFSQIHLDDFVNDPDNSDEQQTWTYSGNSELIVSIDANRIATIATPSPDWTGSELITFTATDPKGAKDANSATFSINASPVVSDIPDQSINQGQSFTTIPLDDYVTDTDNADAEISWSYSGNTNLIVSIDANRIATVTVPNGWAGSENITFTATDPGGLNDSDPALFTVRSAPVVTDIPDQTLNVGESFAQIHLDDYVSDADNGDDEQTWTYSGNSELIVSIDANRVATITPPNPDWAGSETITFTATDPDGLHDNDSAVFALQAAPVVSDIPDQNINQGASFAQIHLDDYVSDADNADDEQTWSYSGNSELIVSIDANRIATITQPADWHGSETITFTATDPTGLHDSNPAVFSANGAPVVSDIPNQSINQGEDFVQIHLDDYVADPDNGDSDITWSYSGNTELNVSIDANRVATITPPNSSWSGSETITFTATDPGGLSDNNAATFAINAPPEVSDIPDQTIYEGETFATFDLDDYVTDPYDTDAGVTWTYSGNSNLTVSIDGSNVVTITYPGGWTGAETITFTATDGGGLSDSDPATFTVLQTNAPVVSDIPDQYISVGQNFATIALDNYVTDPDNAASDMTWTYSGNSDLSVSIDANRVATITPPNSSWSGSETITFTATDPSGLSDSDPAGFTVNGSPVVSTIPNQTINSGQTFTTIHLDDYVADPNDGDENIVWTYSGNQHTHVAINNSRIATITYDAGWSGSETITFTATDPGGLSDNTSSVFNVNGAPVVSDIPDQAISEGQNFTQINLNTYVADPNNNDDEISWAYSGNVELTIDIDASNQATIGFPANWSGSETVTFTATDPGGLSDSDPATFSLNAAPVVTTIPNQSINQGASFATIALDNYVTDANNSKSEITWTFSGNTDLSVSINANRVATIFTPNAEWFGSETITFTATDPGGLADGTAALFSVNAIPVVSNIPNQFKNEGESFDRIALNDYVTDGDNTDTEIHWQATGNHLLSVSISSENLATITYPAGWHGSETILFTATDPSGVGDSDEATFSINSKPVVSKIPDQETAENENFETIALDSYVSDPDNLDNEISWSFSGNRELQISINAQRVVSVIKPALDWAGTETIRFIATDPHQLKDSTMAVFHTNARPQVQTIPGQTINRGQLFTAIALDNFVYDADDAKTTLIWSAKGQSELIVTIDTARVAMVSQPNPNWVGSETIRFVVHDSHGMADSTEVLFKVNAPPEITSIPDQIIPRAQEFTDIDLNEFVSDPDNDDSEIGWVYSGNKQLILGIDVSHILSIQVPYANWMGVDTVMFTASDPMGLAAMDTVILSRYSTNRPPQILSQPDTLIQAKHFYGYQVVVSDPDSGDTKNFVLLKAPAFLSVSDSGLISGTPAIADTGQYDISVMVEDVEAAADTQNYRLTVDFNPSTPVIQTIPGQTIVEGSEFTPVNLNNYVTQHDSEDSLRWSYSGNQQLQVSLDTLNVATVAPPDSNWYGSETINFRVTNRYGQYAEQAVPFVITGVNDPPQLTQIPDQLIYQNGWFEPIDLDSFVNDVDNSDQTLTWTVSGNKYLRVDVDADRQVQITVPSEDWTGSDTIRFKVSDPAGLSAEESVICTVEPSIFNNFATQYVGSGTVVEVRWQTTVAVKGRLLYGTDEPELESEPEEKYGTAHRLVLSGLDENSDYVVRAAAVDSAGQDYFSQLFHVQTKAAGEINVFPNPYRAGRYPDDDVIHFANLPEGGSITVYNFLGEPVFQQKETSSFFTWKVVNNAGRQVQAGLYIWVVKDAQNRKIKSGKIAIIR